MKFKTPYLILLTLAFALNVAAQNPMGSYGNEYSEHNNTFNPNALRKDSANQKKEAPRGMYVWTIDKRFGDRTRVDRDTLQHLFMNNGLTTGRYGEYNTTGNLGAPRINRIFINRKPTSLFSFLDAYDFFLKDFNQLRFTNTLSPITNITFNSCGDRINGEDNFKALFAVNANKRLGAGFKFDYLYGRGYYQNQSTSLFDFTTWVSYLGERYQAHASYTTDHIKITENDGITNDDYIRHPELFKDNFTTSEIPTNLSQNWNNFHTNRFILSHRYNVGFYRRVPLTTEERAAKEFALKAQEEAEKAKKKKEMAEANEKARGQQQTFSGRPDDAKVVGELPTDDIAIVDSTRIKDVDGIVADSLSVEELAKAEAEKWMKDEYVPVTSFIHTFELSDYRRRYIAYQTPENYYLNSYGLFNANENGNLDDQTKLFTMSNTFAIALLEGFNKWAKSGVKVFANHLFSRYRLPEKDKLFDNYTESSLRIGGQLSKTQGSIFHYNVTGDVCTIGHDLGEFSVIGNADVNIPFLKDTVRIDANASVRNYGPDFIFEHFHSTHAWWDNDNLDNIMHMHVGGSLSYPKTRTSLTIGYDNISNYCYLATSSERNSQGNWVNHQLNVRQTSDNISLFTAQLSQNFKLGILNWENKITYQKSSKQDVLPVPDLNAWTNLYLKFKIAKVLDCDFGVAATYFTEYYAPEYNPLLCQFAVQENPDVRTKVGNYPFVDAYANFVLKGCRFYFMMNHINAGKGSRNYFTTPHHPMNDSIFRIGISWTFHN